MTSREQQARQTYEHIMHTAEQLLEHSTYEQLSVNDICEKAGISKGGFYHHFSSKDQLIALLIGRQMEHLIHERVSPLLGKESAFTLLELYMYTGLEYLKNCPKNTLARCWLALSEHSALTAPRFSQTYFALLHQIISQGIEEGHVRKEYDTGFYESFTAAFFTGIMLHTIAYENGLSQEKFVGQSMELLWKALQ